MNKLSNELFPTSFFFRTPLHLAVYEGHEKIVELLLKNKCDVNAKDMVSISRRITSSYYNQFPNQLIIRLVKNDTFTLGG